jgi:hypothetical protein
MTPPRTPKRYRCCGVVFSAWLAVPGAPHGPLLLGHLSQPHPDPVDPYLERIRTEDIERYAPKTLLDG